MATEKKTLILKAGDKPPPKNTKWNELDLYVQFDAKDTAAVFNGGSAEQLDLLKVARDLWKVGAKPRVATLSKGRTLETALEEALPTPEGIALWEMNLEVAYIRNPGMILVPGDGRVMFADAFVRHAYSNRHYQHTVTPQRGDQYLKPAPLAPRWLEWGQRHELDRLTYAPGKPRITDGCWNTWEGWGCEPLKSTKEEVKPFYELVEHLLHDERERVPWFLRWLAYPLQHPGTKLFTSVLIWGGQGVGKSLIGHTMKRIYGKNASVVSAKHLNGDFNPWAANKQFVMGEEMTGDDSRERRRRADELKNLITQLEVTINRKYQPEYVVPDCLNYYLTSNHPDALALEDDDRRFVVFHASRPPIFMPDRAKSEAFYTTYAKWMNGKGPRWLLDHLLKLDLGDFNPAAPAPRTAAKEAMTLSGKSDLGSWCVRLREDPAGALRVHGETKARECALFTSEELRRAYDPEKATRVTARVMGIELSRSGFRQVKAVKIEGRKERLWVVRDGDKWCKAAPQQIAEHYRRFEKGASK